MADVLTDEMRAERISALVARFIGAIGGEEESTVIMPAIGAAMAAVNVALSGQTIAVRHRNLWLIKTAYDSAIEDIDAPDDLPGSP